MTPELLARVAARVGSMSAPAYFVGGCVRDSLLGVPLKDLDFVITGDPQAVGRALVKEFGGHIFWLREEDEVARVLLPDHGLQLDFTVLHSPIEEDLRARDLTLNAMAIPVAAGINQHSALIDPTGGQNDLDACLFQLGRRQTLDRRLRADGHEHRRFDSAMSRVQPAPTRRAIGVQQIEAEGHTDGIVRG